VVEVAAVVEVLVLTLPPVELPSTERRHKVVVVVVLEIVFLDQHLDLCQNQAAQVVHHWAVAAQVAMVQAAGRHHCPVYPMPVVVEEVEVVRDQPRAPPELWHHLQFLQLLVGPAVLDGCGHRLYLVLQVCNMVVVVVAVVVFLFQLLDLVAQPVLVAVVLVVLLLPPPLALQEIQAHLTVVVVAVDRDKLETLEPVRAAQVELVALV
jgi:hypothetical protein